MNSEKNTLTKTPISPTLGHFLTTINLDKDPVQEEARPETEPLEKYPLKLANLNTATVAQIGSVNFFNGGSKLLRLAHQDAEIIAMFETLGAVFSQEEVTIIQQEFFQSLYALGDITGSGYLPRYLEPKPFTITATAQRIEHVGQAIPTTPSNLVQAHKELFPDTLPCSNRCIQHIIQNSTEGSTQTGLSLELTDLTDQDSRTIDQFLEHLSSPPFNYKTKIKPMDLSTAIQSAIQRTCHGNNLRPVLLDTNEKLGNEKIYILAFSGSIIFITAESLEMASKMYAHWFQKERLPVVNFVIEAPFATTPSPTRPQDTRPLSPSLN